MNHNVPSVVASSTLGPDSLSSTTMIVVWARVYPPPCLHRCDGTMSVSNHGQA